MAERRKSNVATPAPSRAQSTLVLDNGAWTIKAGIVRGDDGEGEEEEEGPRVIPNCIARDRAKKIYVGSEVEERCTDYSEMQFRRPVEKGFIVNWEAQKEIWDREIFDGKGSGAMRCGDPSEMRLILTEQSSALPVLQANCDQIVFEEYGFSSYYRGIGSTFNAYHDLQSIFRTTKDPSPAAASTPCEIVMVVDTGYSYTTVTPLLRGRPLHSAVRRIDVGGKLLTNYMARLISLRHFDVRNEACIVNDMKEAACYVSLDFKSDLEKTWKGTRGERREGYVSGAGIVKDYVLPDFHARNKGVLRDYDPARHAKGARKFAAGAHTDEDVLTLRNERFAVPELIFSPSDAGMRQPGLAQAIMQSLHQLPVGLWPALLANIVVVGGSSLFDGFIRRLQRELMQLVPDDCVVRVARPADPITHAWRGAASMARHGDVDRVVVTRQEYEENGSLWVSRRFAGPWT